MSQNNKHKTFLAQGLRGKVEKIDDAGDAYIDFGLGKKQWVHKKSLGKLRKVHIDDIDGTGRKPAVTINTGATVTVQREFASNSKTKVMLRVGDRGVIDRIDQAGDAYVTFTGYKKKQWVKKHNLGYLRIDEKAQAPLST